MCSFLLSTYLLIIAQIINWFEIVEVAGYLINNQSKIDQYSAHSTNLVDSLMKKIWSMCCIKVSLATQIYRVCFSQSSHGCSEEDIAINVLHKITSTFDVN